MLCGAVQGTCTFNSRSLCHVAQLTYVKYTSCRKKKLQVQSQNTSELQTKKHNAQQKAQDSVHMSTHNRDDAYRHSIVQRVFI